MSVLKVFKALNPPATLDASSLYLVKSGTDTFSIYLTDKDGLVLHRSPDTSDISTIVMAIVNALKGQPGGLGSLDLDGYVEQAYASVAAIDGQEGDLGSLGLPIWDSIEDAICKLSLLNDTSVTDPTRIVTFNGMQGWLFAPSVLTQVFPKLQVPSDIALNTDAYICLHWMPGSGAIGNVRWGIEYSIMKSHQQGMFPATTIQYVTQYVDSTVDLIRNYTTELAMINSVNLEPGSTIMMRIFRDGANLGDTFLGNTSPYLMSLKYQKTRLGTRNRTPNFYI